MKTLKILTLVLLFSGASLAQQGTRFSYKLLPETVPQSVTVHLDSAQIVNLKGTPIQLVAAPGVDTMVIPIMCNIFYSGQGKTPYDVSGGGGLVLRWDNTIDWTNPLTILPTILTDTVNDVGFMGCIGSMEGSYHTFSDIQNKGFFITQSGAGEFISGNATMDVTLTYLKAKK